jgi:hypothetical protein
MSEGKKLFVTFYPEINEIEFFIGGETKFYSVKDYSEIYPGKFKFRVKDLFGGEEYEYFEEYRDLNVNDLKGLLKMLFDQTEKALELLIGKRVPVTEVVYEEEYEDDW